MLKTLNDKEMKKMINDLIKVQQERINIIEKNFETITKNQNIYKNDLSKFVSGMEAKTAKMDISEIHNEFLETLVTSAKRRDTFETNVQNLLHETSVQREKYEKLLRKILAEIRAMEAAGPSASFNKFVSSRRAADIKEISLQANTKTTKYEF